MRVSSLFGQTLREAPTEADTASHAMLLRAGYVRQLAAGLFSYLPLAQRSLQKIERILRDEMDRIGGQEMCMPVVHPAELWQKTGRWYDIGDTMGRLKDRKGRDLVLAMTHEEVVAHLCKTEVRSYRQLPMMVYHIQTKFRDEPRARGGLIRTREFVMKDSYTLDSSEEGLREQYVRHYDAYHRIGVRAGLELVAVRSDVGMMGGKIAHEFMYISPSGEDSLAICDSTGYASNLEVAEFRRQPMENGDPRPLERVHTPGAATIEDLSAYLGIAKEQTAKMVFFTGDFGPDAPKRIVIGLVRGDMEVNILQLQYLAGARELLPADDEAILEIGATPGFASPYGIDKSKAIVVADSLVADSTNLVVGANAVDYHFTGANHGRDYEADVVGPIALAYDGAPDPIGGDPLRVVRGIEVGNIFQLGTRYSTALGATFTDDSGREQPIVMGSYGIGVGRLLACVAEEYSDDYGMNLPVSVAPFHVALIVLSRNPDVHRKAEMLYAALREANIEVLFDDRDASPGVKFADADLRGMPLRVTVSERSLRRGGAEFGLRRTKDIEIVPLDDVPERACRIIAELHAELAQRPSPTWKSDQRLASWTPQAE